MLQDLVASGEAPAAITALYGRIVTEGQDDERFQWWLARTDERTKDFADYWAALGTYLISQRRFDEAACALLEAMDRDPTDLNSAGRLVQAYSTLGDEDASQRWVTRWSAINESLKANNRVGQKQQPHPNDIAELAASLQALDRTLEAVLWKSLEAHYRGTLADEMNQWNQRRIELVDSASGFPTRDQRLSGFDPSDHKTPELNVARQVKGPMRKSNRSPGPSTTPEFTNIAAQVGLDHAYQVADQPHPFGFAIYQTLGGAVIAMDYDLDRRNDLYFTQGGSGPPTFQGRLSNQLYRQLHGSLRDVTGISGADNYEYSSGATAGDWNQDGFPDLVIANLGQDILLINNGDGTFTSRPLSTPPNRNRIASSIAMADLTGDNIPDIYKVIYIDDPGMIMRPETNDKGEVVAEVLPFQFDPGPDQILIGDGYGGMDYRVFSEEQTDARLGLGLVVTDFNNRPGNEIFVGNDVYPDQLWVRDAANGNWSDVAPAIGCAFGVRGSKTASMGIAAGDLDNSGTLDLHVTNFQHRNSSLFINLGEAFVERNVQFAIADSSQSVLGWGTQAIDYDNDTKLDLAVTNGHVEKSLAIDAPFEQRPQLYCNLGNRFELKDVIDPSEYWAGKHLGRALARLDFNQDGKNDFVITHLGESSALMINRTETFNHWLQLRLVGVVSERDAIGARIRIRFGQQVSTEWVVAGDGYLCKNEPIVSFGLGRAQEVDEISIGWPSGIQQSFQQIGADQRLLIVEGQSESFQVELSDD